MWELISGLNSYLEKYQIMFLNIEVDDVLFRTSETFENFDCNSRIDNIPYNEFIKTWLDTIPEIYKVFYSCRELGINDMRLITSFSHGSFIRYSNRVEKTKDIPFVNVAVVDVDPKVLKKVMYKIIIDRTDNKGIIGPRICLTG